MSKSDKAEYEQAFLEELQSDYHSFRDSRRAEAEAVREPLFHYASPEAFYGIVENGKMWLSNAAYLNDANELEYPVQLCRDLIDNMLHPVKPRDSMPLELLRRQVLTKILSDIEKHALWKPWYTASFSLERDRLSQWRAYCPIGGYAIGFNGPRLFDALRIEHRL